MRKHTLSILVLAWLSTFPLSGQTDSFTSVEWQEDVFALEDGARGPKRFQAVLVPPREIGPFGLGLAVVYERAAPSVAPNRARLIVEVTVQSDEDGDGTIDTVTTQRRKGGVKNHVGFVPFTHLEPFPLDTDDRVVVDIRIGGRPALEKLERYRLTAVMGDGLAFPAGPADLAPDLD